MNNEPGGRRLAAQIIRLILTLGLDVTHDKCRRAKNINVLGLGAHNMYHINCQTTTSLAVIRLFWKEGEND
jgi:hypothetical protein